MEFLEHLGMACRMGWSWHFTGVVTDGALLQDWAPTESHMVEYPNTDRTGVCCGREWSELVVFGAWLFSRTRIWLYCGTLLQGLVT